MLINNLKKYYKKKSFHRDYNKVFKREIGQTKKKNKEKC